VTAESQPHATRSDTDGIAIASLVLGILWLLGLGSLLALIFGYTARSRIRRSGAGGSGLALAGIILGWVGIVGAVLVVVLGLAIGMTAKKLATTGPAASTGAQAINPAPVQNAAPTAPAVLNSSAACMPKPSELTTITTLDNTNVHAVVTDLVNLRSEAFASGNPSCFATGENPSVASDDAAGIAQYQAKFRPGAPPEELTVQIASLNQQGEDFVVTYTVTAASVGVPGGLWQATLDRSGGSWVFADLRAAQ